MVRPAPAASRALRILDLLLEHPMQSFNLSEVSRATGLKLASTQTVLAELVNAGYVVRHSGRKTYALGPLMAAFGHAANLRYPGLNLATRDMQRLGREFDKELLVIAAAGSDLVAVSRWGRRLPRGLDIGQRVPLAAPLGGIFVAWAGEAEVEQWLDAGDVHDPSTRAMYVGMLSSTRLRGYSVTMETSPQVHSIIDAIGQAAANPEPSARQVLRSLISSLEFAHQDGSSLQEPNRYAVRTIAGPIFDDEGRVRWAISTADLPSEMSVQEITEIGSRLRDAGASITRQTDGRLPASFGTPVT